VDHIGYAYLVEQFRLAALPLHTERVLSDAVPGRRLKDLGGRLIEEFARRYAPKPTLLGHLRFALRYEGLNLEVLKLLFERTGREEIQAALREEPQSAPVRRLAYLFEWLTGQSLEPPSGAAFSKLRYTAVLDDSLQFGLALDMSPRIERYRLIDNLPGTSAFCPLVRKTVYLEQMVKKGLHERTRAKLEKYDRQLVMRAAAYLYLKETQSSFEVERVKPSASRAQRFADLLQEAEAGQPLSEERFVELQNAVVDPRFAEASYRVTQNWVGTDLGYRARADFVPPRPEEVRSLMDGLVAMSERLRERSKAIDPVIAASAISFGFVFVHPFLDGNGRLHRYLIHEQLSTAGFTPKGIILPVSAVILAHLDRYKDTLEAFSRQVLKLTSYEPTVPTAPATGNDAVYFRYFDATEQACFLYDALERTVEHDLDEEISFLLGFDRARAALSTIADWPAHSLETFIRVVRQNGGRLSINKRKAHFDWMTEEEIARFERIVERAFRLEIDPDDIAHLPVPSARPS
jgi:Fic/DOC family